MRTAILLLAAIGILTPAWAARAEDAPAGERPFCADRPGKATPPCTLEPGRVQVEVDAYDWAHDRADGVTTTAVITAAPTLKLGLTANSELQLAWNGYERQSESGSGHAEGIGDAFVRWKWNLAHNDADRSVAIMPFVKLPTAAHGLGNGKAEGGLIAPAALALPGGWGLGVSPEVDLDANGSGTGRHLAGAAAASLGHALTPTVSLAAEAWVERDFVSRAATLATADLVAAWQPAGLKGVQFDAGVNLGLTRATSDLEAYVGVSKRF